MAQINKKLGRIVLAMDLSLNGSAFAVLDIMAKNVKIKELRFIDNSVLKNKSHGEKLANIYFNLDDIIHKHQITDFVRERGFTMHNATTQALFKVVGVVDFTLYCNDIKEQIDEIAPTSVKKFVTGSGKAEKSEVASAVRSYITKGQRDVVFETDDVSDAVAVGVAYCLKNGLIK